MKNNFLKINVILFTITSFLCSCNSDKKEAYEYIINLKNVSQVEITFIDKEKKEVKGVFNDDNNIKTFLDSFNPELKHYDKAYKDRRRMAEEYFKKDGEIIISFNDKQPSLYIDINTGNGYRFNINSKEYFDFFTRATEWFLHCFYTDNKNNIPVK